jgi:hypothetical protein
MTNWEWWAGEIGAETYDLACGEKTRDAAFKTASDLLDPGTEFQIVEARTSTAAKYEGADFVPFVRTRNYERATA